MAEDVIKLLPDSVANQIAAGEVIQCPASVIKELVENSIDAGADNIQIVLKDAGKTLIQVVDNGCGMSVTDSRLAFERHATSKIRKADDLFALHTMGFRGEALPSVAAVSEVEMRTMRRDDSIGTRLTIKASEVISQEACVCTVGTNIMVKHLFYNFVARRRYLKKDSQELAGIMHEFERLALVNTDVEFSLTHNGKLIHQLTRSPLRRRIGELFGKSVEQNVIPIETATNLIKISGFIGLPDSARRRSPLQYFFVNGRNMRHNYFRKAVLNCYKDLIPADMQPNFFISFEIDPDRIDVNVHPQKHEIKFEDEQLVFQILTAAIKESLGQFNVAPAIDFNATDVPDIPPIGSITDAPLSPVSDDFDPDYTPFETSNSPANVDPFSPEGRAVFSLHSTEIPTQSRLFTNHRPEASGTFISSGLNRKRDGVSSSAINRDWDKLYDAFLNPEANAASSSTDSTKRNEQPGEALHDSLATQDSSSTKGFIQCKNRYLVSDSKSGLLLIDQHRAHLLVLFNSIIEKINKGSLSSQYLLIEENVELDAVASAIAADNVDRLREVGFIVERSSETPTLWILKSIPSTIQPGNAADTFRSIIADIAEQTDDTDDQARFRSRLALSLARASAIRGSVHMSQEEIDQLVTELFRLPSPGFTPDGLPVMHIIPFEEIQHMFQR